MGNIKERQESGMTFGSEEQGSKIKEGTRWCRLEKGVRANVELNRQLDTQSGLECV